MNELGKSVRVEGKGYRASLRDGRRIYVDGAHVEDVGADARFLALNVGRAAETYDQFARDPARREAFMTPSTNVGQMRARTADHIDELQRAKRLALKGVGCEQPAPGSQSLKARNVAPASA